VTESLHVHRSLARSPEQVWHAFTDPAALAGWFWPERFATVAEVDPHVGGCYRIDGPGAGMAVGGTYVEVQPPSRLAFTWQWDGDAADTQVTVELVRTPTGTDVLVTHGGFADAADRDRHVQGWDDCLDRLPGWLSGATA
jgi:uncharacterized protein YndB with AHSA1/START domain